MYTQKWLDNYEFVWSILEEIIVEDNLVSKISILREQYEYLMNKIYQSRHSYENYNIMNRTIMIEMKKILENIKRQPKKKVRIQEVKQLVPNDPTPMKLVNPLEENSNIPITNEELRNERNNKFNDEFQRKQNEFNNTMNMKTPDEIDFKDKVDDKPANIDKLMEEEMKRRSYEIANIATTYNNNAEEWIYNGNKKENVEEKKEINNLEVNKNVNKIENKGENTNNRNETSNNGRETSNNGRETSNNGRETSNNQMITLELIKEEENIIEVPNRKQKLTKGFLDIFTKDENDEVPDKKQNNSDIEYNDKQEYYIKDNESIKKPTLVLTNNTQIELDKEDYIEEIGFYNLGEKLKLRELREIKIPNTEIEYYVNELGRSIKTEIKDLNKIDLEVNKKKYYLLKRNIVDNIVIYKTNNIVFSNNTYIRIHI